MATLYVPTSPLPENDYCLCAVQGGLASWDDYSYCSGNGKCFPCPAHGYNKTLCGPPTPYCNMSQSCAAGLKKNKFVPGLKVKSYISIGKVCYYISF